MSRKIFIGGLNWTTSEAELRNVFQRFGSIQNLKIVTDNHSGRSKGYAFITFDNDMSAQVALSQMDGRQIDGKTVRVNDAFERTDEHEDDELPPKIPHKFKYDQQRENHQRGAAKAHTSSSEGTIYVGGMNYSTTEETIYSSFESFGNIHQIKMVSDPETGLSKGFCFITFTEKESASEAIEQMNGTVLDGQPVRVSRAQYKEKPKFSNGGHGSSHHNNNLNSNNRRPHYRNARPQG